MKYILKTKRNIILLILGLSILVLSVFGITYSFMTLIGSDSIGETNVGSNADTLKDTLVFTAGDPFELSPGIHNLNSEGGNLTTSSTSSVSLTPIKDSSLAKYYVYFIIDENDYEYTTYDSKPELILTITDYNGNEITEIEGLEHVTSGAVTGFDVTTASGEIIVGEYSLLAENGNTVSHEWTFKLTMINLDSNQNANYDKVFKGGAYLNQSVENANQVFTYTGDVQTFTAMRAGTYQIETWGAQGGNVNTTIIGGSGAYTSGNINLEQGDTLYLYIGGQGSQAYSGNQIISCGFNGGGSGGYSPWNDGPYAGGGGATDVRLIKDSWNDTESLNSRIMVSAAGSGVSYYMSASSNSAAAGGLIGYPGKFYRASGSASYINSTGATQTHGGVGAQNSQLLSGQFGISYCQNMSYGSGGGSGYYSGGSGTSASAVVGSGSSGSSFISGHTGSVAITSETNRIPKNTGELLVDFPIRYIEIGSNNSNANAYNHTSEVQAIDLNGNNVALNKTVEGTIDPISLYDNFNIILDGDYSTTPSSGYVAHSPIIMVDLEQGYDLSSVNLWRYYADGRTYYETYVKVYNEDKTKSAYLHNYETDGTYTETSAGKTMQLEGSTIPCETGTTDNSCSIHYSGKYFADTVMIDGAGYNWTNVIGEQVAMPNPLGGYYELGEGHTGNGYARITYIGS